MAKRTPAMLGLCFLVFPLSLVAAIYWLFFLQNHKARDDEDVTKAEQEATVEFSIPGTVVGCVIGKRGGNVRQVEESTSTRIKFKAGTLDDKIVVITGRPEAVARARAAIEATVETRLKPDDPNTVSMVVPRCAVGRIIGRQGSNIRSMQRETGAQISINSSGTSGDERVCTIKGSDTQVRKAQQLLRDAIMKITERSEAIAVPLETVGRIIGKQGSNIQRIQQESGSIITYDQSFSGDGMGRFLVRGTEDQIQEARRMLLGLQTEATPLQSAKLLAMSKLPNTGEYFSTFVSAVEGDGDVWLQEVGPNCTELDGLVEAMTSVYDNLTSTHDRLSRVSVGTLCVAPFGSDSSWYRAVVEGLDANGTATLRFVDFGDTSVVELATLKALRAEYLTLPAQAVRCSLAHVKQGKHWSVHSELDLSTLTKCSTWTPLMARVINCTSIPPTIELIDTTTDEDIDIASEMVTLGHMEWIQDTSLTLKPSVFTYVSLPSTGSVFTAFLTAVHNPALLFIQPQGFLSEIRMFTEHMNKLYVGPQTMHISTFAPGDVVAASSSDDQSWYRAQVISYAQGDDSVLLRYLDYGDCHRVRVHMIRPLLPELMHYPVFTVPCCLAGVVPNGLTWDPAATKLVQEHAKAGQDMPLSAVISSYVETENGKLAAVTLSAEGQPINALLIEAGLAQQQQTTPAIRECGEERHED
ncbi:hypothetical protein EMCRGX_G029817 [Ephydatia muelleri]